MTDAMASYKERKPVKIEDDADIFAKNIANKLRKVKDPQVRALAEFEIENICFKASMGNLTPTFSNSNSQGMYVPTSPQQAWGQSYATNTVVGDQGNMYAQL